MPLLTTKHKITITRLLQRFVLFFRHFLGFRSLTDVRRSGFYWQLDLEEGIDFVIYALGAFERTSQAAYRRLIEPGSVVIDIGANIGAHTLPLARQVGPGGRVFAFEPMEWATKKLRANLERNPELISRVTIEQIKLIESPAAYSSELETTLDDYLAAEEIFGVDFVRLDVDGHECAVLRGAHRLLREFRPVVRMKLAPHLLKERGESLGSLLAVLGAAGYGLVEMRNEKPLPMKEKRLHHWVPRGVSRNVLALPEECIITL